MKHSLVTTVPAAAVLVIAAGSLAPAHADPKPVDDGIQVSVCDNGQTYTFPVVSHSADQSVSFHHAPQLVPDSNVILQPVSFTGTVSFVVDGVVVDSFSTGGSVTRKPNPKRTITCATTYRTTLDDGTIVLVEGTDVFEVAGR